MTVTFGHRRFGKRVQQLRAVLDDAAVLLHGAGQKSGHVLERDERNVERVAEPHEPRAFDRRVDVERAGEHRRLVGDDADRPAVEPREADDDVPRVVLVHLEKVAIVGHRVNQIEHVVRLIRRRRHQAIERRILAVGRIAGSLARRRTRRGCSTAGTTAARGSSARHSRSSSTAKCATPLVALWVIAPPSSSLRDLLVRHRLDHVGPGHEHVARVPDHDREVGDGRRIHGAARARAHDRGNLRHDARRQRVAQKDVGVAAEREHAFLNARAARIVQADDRRAELHRQIHDLHDLRGVGLRQRSAEDREVLREREHLAPVDQARGRRRRRRRE